MARHHLSGAVFQTEEGVMFRVVEAETYPATKVSRQYKDILAFKPNVLVAVMYRGTCIPNITGKNGVVRLTKVEAGGKVLDRPGRISDALKIKAAMKPYELERVR